jgi:tRNA pseudouridine55 synthase
MSRRNPKGREINGVVLLDKAQGLSSNTALQQIKRLFFAKKAGHTGALDPLATGILPICLGQATKIAQFLLADDKRYIVCAQLGQTTTTGDSEGELLETKEFTHLSTVEIQTAALSFQGDILQIPPMYSALKRNGQPLYKLARQGIEVERKARPVCIYHIQYLNYKNGLLNLEVSCSKGTYIRTLMEDIGQKLGCGAHITSLRRTGFSHLNIEQSVTFSTLENLTTNSFDDLDKFVIPSHKMLPNIANIQLNKQQSEDICFGRQVEVDEVGHHLVKIFNSSQLFLGIGELNNTQLQPKRLFI